MGEPSLFEDESPPLNPKKKGDPLTNDGSVKWVMFGVYWPLYVAHYREEPYLLIKHWAQLKRLVVQYGPEVVSERLQLFFGSGDEFIRSSGHAIGVFVSVWPKLAAEAAKRRQMHGGTVRVRCTHQPTCRSASEHSRRMLDSLRPSGPSEFSRTTSKPSDVF